MSEDRYTRFEREDSRSICEREGHDFREINSRTKTKLERVTWTEEETAFTSGFCDGIPYKRDAEHSKLQLRTVEVVTYECSVCKRREVREI